MTTTLILFSSPSGGLRSRWHVTGTVPEDPRKRKGCLQTEEPRSLWTAEFPISLDAILSTRFGKGQGIALDARIQCQGEIEKGKVEGSGYTLHAAVGFVGQQRLGQEEGQKEVGARSTVQSKRTAGGSGLDGTQPATESPRGSEKGNQCCTTAQEEAIWPILRRRRLTRRGLLAPTHHFMILVCANRYRENPARITAAWARC